jgi:hypothetical protein
MNTTPDEALLALWVEDELDGTHAREIDAWATGNPEWLDHRDQARRTRKLLRAHLPASEEPPHAEFFNARIAREIAREAARPEAAPRRTWRWFLPATAVVGMVLCFWAGTRMAPTPSVPPPVVVVPPPTPLIYTPEKGVKAAYFESEPAEVAVIVLEGVSALPDSFNLPDTAAVDLPAASIALLEAPTP